MNLSAFKAYDVRGRIPDEINIDLAYQIGRAYAAFVKPKKVCVGRDIRLSSAELVQALIRGLTDSGVNVSDIGLCGTEGVYFATFAYEFDGGIMVTASHNPPDYNGMKFVREGSRPISADSGLKDMAAMICAGQFAHDGAASANNTTAKAIVPGTVSALDTGKRYLDHLLSYVRRDKLRKLKVVVNAGNGGAGLIIDQLEPYLPFEFIKIHHEPDGTFPHGVPNPLLEENRQPTIDAIRQHGADVALAWDGDYDRCFFFDERGTFIEGYYIVGLLASAYLKRYPGGSIVHDPRLTWNTIEMVKAAGGTPVLCKSGHAFIKKVMRDVDAVYGGEMSAHHYFRDFAYCDSGMIPWLMVLQEICLSGKSLSQLVGERMKAFPVSGEINLELLEGKAALPRIQKLYEKEAKSIDFTDGLSMEFDQWRFNLRTSNTEPLVRLNVESRGDEALIQAKTKALLAQLRG